MSVAKLSHSPQDEVPKKKFRGSLLLSTERSWGSSDTQIRYHSDIFWCSRPESTMLAGLKELEGAAGKQSIWAALLVATGDPDTRSWKTSDSHCCSSSPASRVWRLSGVTVWIIWMAILTAKTVKWNILASVCALMLNLCDSHHASKRMPLNQKGGKVCDMVKKKKKTHGTPACNFELDSLVRGGRLQSHTGSIHCSTSVRPQTSAESSLLAGGHQRQTTATLGL